MPRSQDRSTRHLLGVTPTGTPRGARRRRAPTRLDGNATRRLERRRRRDETADALAALASLLHAKDLPALLDAIVAGAARHTRAREVELHLHALPATHAVRRVAAPGSGRSSGSAPPQRLVLPLRDGDERLATLRLLAPRSTRLEALHFFLAQAGPVLGHTLRRWQALQEAERYEALLQHLPDWCVLVLSRDGVVRESRGGSTLLSGADHWIGRPLESRPGEPGVLALPRPRVRQILASARRSGRADLEAQVQGRNGATDVHLTLVSLGSEGELLCVLRDLSTMRAMEKALLRRNQELSEAAERLKEVDMLKNEFLSNVSHELRTPLTAIIAYTEALLLTRPEEEKREQFLRVIAEQGQKLQKLIAGLLDIAKLDSLATELKLQLGSLNQVIQAAVVTVRPTADKNRISIHLDLDPELPLVYLDELRSQQIVWNLLTNAIKFSPPEAEVRVRTWSEEGVVWAAITDAGIGIAPEHHGLIFEKFVQLDGSTTRRHGGVGLGLDLVRHLVELHGGQVQVESSLGKGATFSFCIPVEKRRRPRGAQPRSERVGRAS